MVVMITGQRESLRNTVTQPSVTFIFISHVANLFCTLSCTNSLRCGVYGCFSFLEPLHIELFPYVDIDVFKSGGRVYDQVTFFYKNLSFVPWLLLHHLHDFNSNAIIVNKTNKKQKPKSLSLMLSCWLCPWPFTHDVCSLQPHSHGFSSPF